MNEEYTALYPWSFSRDVPVAVRAEGVYIYDEDGKRYLDGSGGAVAANIGHSNRAIVEAVYGTLSDLSYVHASHFRTHVGEDLAALLAGKFPGPTQQAKVLFTSGGSEATESAIKLARRYWLSRNEPKRHKIISRWQSYHGATLGALGLSGNLRRRAPYVDLLPPGKHISSCLCQHCPLTLQYPSCELACARELEQAIVETGADTVAGFIFEPIVGATSGAVPPEGYLSTIQEICNRYGILLIADEIMTGSGRTGRYFAVEHWDIRPDIILMGKGLSGGYGPLGAVLMAEHVWRPIHRAAASLEHSFTYQASPPSIAAGLAVQKYLAENDLVQQAARRGDYLRERLMELRRLPYIGDVRGLGLLWTVEFVIDAKTLRPFPQEYHVSERIFNALRERGVILYPGRGAIDGVRGDHMLIAPPFIIEESQIDFMVDALKSSIEQVIAGVHIESESYATV